MSTVQTGEIVKRRLKSLNEYSIMDSISEKEYDTITRLASQICGTPISLITLLNTKRQWFKSHHGTDLTETPIEHSFCAHAVCNPKDVMVVPDARKDERFNKNPLVTETPHIVFYTGVPLVNPKGVPLGTLCVIDTEERRLSEEQIQSLRDLATQVMAHLEGRKTRYDLKRANEMLRQQNQAFKRFSKMTAQLLKAPLEQITRYTERYLNLHKKELVPGHIESLLTTKAAADNMKTLISGLLNNIENRQSLADKKQTVEIAKLQSHLQSMFRNSVDRQLSFRFKMDTVELNQSALLEIFSQLIANAFNFCDKDVADIEVGGRILDDYYEFFVADNGPGIEVEDQHKIFDIFYVLQPFDRYGEFNTGIGLATVKRLVEELKGEVTVESSPGEGTIFSFSVPI